jgi:hypothetical protein
VTGGVEQRVENDVLRHGEACANGSRDVLRHGRLKRGRVRKGKDNGATRQREKGSASFGSGCGGGGHTVWGAQGEGIPFKGHWERAYRLGAAVGVGCLPSGSCP